MTPKTTPDPELIRMLDEAEQEYLRRLPLEHFMEASAQGKQREITLESFALIHAARPDVQCFNELLVQYPRSGRKKLGQVVPDNMVVIHPEPIQVRGNFSTHVQPVGPFLVLEYVSKYNKRKDYDDNYDRYEQELKVPYYLLFYPDNQELTVFRLADGKYTSVTPNVAGRLPVPELELEAGLLDGWVRFWFRGELLPLPGELLKQLNAVREQLGIERQARQAAEQRAAAAEAELTRLREELARVKGQP
jgi:Uma2 family endonuclease